MDSILFSIPSPSSSPSLSNLIYSLTILLHLLDMTSSAMDDARVNRLPLSSSMRGLLGKLLRVIDERVSVMGEAKLWADVVEDPKLTASTCDMCCGTGFILTEVEVGAGKGKAIKDACGGTMDPVPGYPPSPVVPPSEEMLAFLGVKQAPAVEPNSSSSSNSADALVTGLPGVSTTHDISSSTFTPFAPIDPGPSPTSLPPATSPPSTIHVTSSSSTPIPVSGTGPAATHVSTGVSTSSPLAAADGNFVVPPASAVIPGFDSLGPLHPVPKPADAVFCTEADGPPFYAVTRGKRVGCFGGWDVVSPYVVKAPGVVYAKKPSLIAAYDVYTKAYERGAAMYI